jgi:uncharacterized protein (TIGR03067 family)
VAGALLAGLTGLVVRAGVSWSPAAPAQDQPPPAVAKPDANGARQPPKKDPNPDRPGRDRQGDDRAAMVGTWQSSVTVPRTVNGIPLPPEVRKVRWVITADKIMQTDHEGFIEEEWAFRLDSTKNPPAIDLTSRYGTLSGIYRLEGGRLTLSLGSVGKRPTEFPKEKDWLWDLRRLNREPGRAVRRYANAPGCYWMIDPTPPPVSMASAGIVFLYHQDQDGAARITLAGATPGPKRPEYRPVLLDAGKKRYLPESVGASGSSGLSGGPIVALSRWRMDPKVLPAHKVALIGIEALTPDFHLAAAREAAERARKAGVDVLPWPEVGKAYAFRLTTIDGRVLRSEDFKGKVVVIDCWATWCSPCMALVPELKRLHERWHKDGLEIIGVSFDRSAETVRDASKSRGMTWPQVLVPTEGKARQLWQEAAGVESIPRVLVIDRAGVLRFDTSDKLEEIVARLLRAPKQQSAARSKP